jgi:hypothetical protein
MLSAAITLQPATIANGASLSGAVAMGPLTLVGISMPATWTAAVLTFQVSPDGGTTWQELYDDSGSEVTFQAAGGRYISIQNYPSYLWRGINMVKVRSGTSAAPVNQGQQSIVNLATWAEML